MSADLQTPYFTDRDKAREYLEAVRWNEGRFCPHCGVVDNAVKLEPKGKKGHARQGVWQCRDCRGQFTVTVGTIFEDSHIPLNIWLLAIHLMCSSKKGMSAHQLHRMLGVTYKSAWFMAHRIRHGMAPSGPPSKMSGPVEVDEVYIGGKEKYVPGMESKKASVVSLLDRERGTVRSWGCPRCS
jgi:transposase-like protein